MGNFANLTPIKKGQLTKEEAIKRAKNGGIKSGEVRRRKRLWSEVFRALVSSPVLEKEKIEQVTKIFTNLKGENITYQEILAMKVFQSASKGDLNAINLIIDRMDGKAKETVTQNVNVGPTKIEKEDLQELMKLMKE